MKLSIIVPVYNLEEYIEKCLSTLWMQDVDCTEYEVIIINDGSIDNSLKIMSDFVSQKTNVKIISQKNQTQSVARNNGLKIAKGEYIWFVDGDDWIKSNCFDEILKICSSNNLDILHFSSKHYRHKDDSVIEDYHVPSKFNNKIFSGTEFLNARCLSLVPTFYIYSFAFLKKNNLKFYEGIYHEDNEFLPRTIYFAQKMLCVDSFYYNSLVRPNSTITGNNPKKIFDLLIVVLEIIRFSKNVDSLQIKKVFYFYSSLSFNTLMSLMIKNHDKKITNKLKSELKEHKNKIASAMVNSGNLKYIFEGFCLYISFNFLKFIIKNVKR